MSICRCLINKSQANEAEINQNEAYTQGLRPLTKQKKTVRIDQDLHCIPTCPQTYKRKQWGL